MKIAIENAVATLNCKNIDRYTISNGRGVSVSVLNLGGIISSIIVPVNGGTNIVLGFDDVNKYNSDEYLSNYPYFGAICGRVANRIGNGTFELNNVKYQLNKNNNGSHLHGGNEGFDRKIWDVKVSEHNDHITLHLSYISPDGEEFYPGTLKANVSYTLFENNTFSISYMATTDIETPVNLTNHTYFNLTGNKTDISRMQILVDAKSYTPLNELLVPTGEIKLLRNQPNDLYNKISFEEGFKNLTEGYDYNYILNNKGRLKHVATIKDPVNNISVAVSTTQPAMQVYSGYYIPTIDGAYGRFSGVALETQHYPDAPNKPDFPSIFLKPNQLYNQITIWKIGF